MDITEWLDNNAEHTISYAGWTVKKTGDGWIGVDEAGCNGLPGGCTHKSSEAALASVQLFLAVGEDAEKFWHLNYAIRTLLRTS